MTGLRVTPTAHRGEGLDEALRRGANVLRHAGIEQYRADAELLAAYLLGTGSQGVQCSSYGKTQVTRADVQRFALMGRRITPQDSVRYTELLECRAQRVPLQHITGVAPFYHLEIKVGPGVFIPRPETELLVEEALRVLATYESNACPRVVDLCTGSGAIAAAVKEENPQAEVFAVELSEQALLWARKNLGPHTLFRAIFVPRLKICPDTLTWCFQTLHIFLPTANPRLLKSPSMTRKWRFMAGEKTAWKFLGR